MKKSKLLLVSLIALTISLTGCGKTTSSEPANLSGTWAQTNSNSEDMYHVAAIDDDTITIYWYTPSDDTYMLYWTGTYKAPTQGGDYSWESQNYSDITDTALLASTDSTKKFDFSNDQISYEASMMGVTKTIKLSKSDKVSTSTKKGTAAEELSETNEEDSSLADNVVTEPTQSAQEVSDQLDIEAKPTKDGQVAVFITNNSKTVIDELEVQINYLNEAGEVIDISTDGHDMILPGYTVVSQMDTPSGKFANANIEYNLELNAHPSYENHSDNIQVESNAGDDCVIVKITNNDNVSIDEVEYDVVLFQGEDVVAICYPEDIYDLGAGQTKTEKVSVYNHRTYDSFVYGKDYDRIEVYINQAHTFGF